MTFNMYTGVYIYVIRSLLMKYKIEIKIKMRNENEEDGMER